MAALRAGCTGMPRWLRIAVALLLNGIFLPFGYLYLKKVDRFFVGLAVAILAAPLVRLLLWSLPDGSPPLASAAALLVLGFAVKTAFLLDTYFLARREPGPAVAWMRFPHVLWSVPLTLLTIGLADLSIGDFSRRYCDAHSILTSSMAPGLLAGDYVFVRGITDRTELRRGDIVRFRPPFEKERHYLKRVIGLPGERLLLESEQLAGRDVLRITVNGRRLPLGPRSVSLPGDRQAPTENDAAIYREQTESGRSYYVSETKADLSGIGAREVQLRRNEFFVIGDARDDSSDSRIFGPVPAESIVGRYDYTYFSLDFGEDECSKPFENRSDCPQGLRDRISRMRLRPERILQRVP